VPVDRFLCSEFLFQRDPIWNPVIAIHLVTGYRLDGRGPNPDRGKNFLFSTAPILAYGLPVQWTPEGYSPGVRAAGTKYSPLSSVEVKNGGVMPLPAPYIRL
jgi:hypothetical protein